jgi:hypothetical protein
MSTGRRTAGASLLIAACLCVASACAGRRGTVHPELEAVGEHQDVLALSDALEALIAADKDTLADREYAYHIAHAHNEDTAPATFARAAVTGRLVQRLGLRAVNLVPEIESSARRSQELDPEFRGGAATRLLGTLYVMAPAALLQHGDSEIGLGLLEGLVEAHPEVPENHLRLAEAYIALGDSVPAGPHLCLCLAQKSALRADDQKLLKQLIDSARLPPCPATKG